MSLSLFINNVSLFLQQSWLLKLGVTALLEKKRPKRCQTLLSWTGSVAPQKCFWFRPTWRSRTTWTVPFGYNGGLYARNRIRAEANSFGSRYLPLDININSKNIYININIYLSNLIRHVYQSVFIKINTRLGGNVRWLDTFLLLNIMLQYLI